MAEVLGTQLPDVSFGLGLPSVNWMLFLAIFVFVLAGAIMFYVFYSGRMYNRRIIVFENIAGQGYQPSIKDKARVIRVGDGGEELLVLKKKKVYRTAYGQKMGKNTYWFAIGQDGYWYNIVLGDLDAKMGMLDIEPIDRDMRYMHVAIRKNIQQRYQKQKFMEKYGTIVMNSVFLLIMLVGIYFIVDKTGELMAQVNAALKIAVEVQQTNKEILISLDNILTGGGGLEAIKPI